MFKLRAREERGKTLTDWLDSSHSFSFAQYFDPFNMGFSDLRVINDDIVAPDGGFKLHPHANMEIISIILSGELEHKDSMGVSQILHPGHVQVMSAGFLQIWILPHKKNFDPSYSSKEFSKDKMHNRLCLIVSGSGERGSLKIHQDAEVYQCIIDADKTVLYDLPENRKQWIQVAKGAIEVNSNILEAGDGMSVVNEHGELEITGVDDESNFVLFNLRNLTL